jgi:prephenate dehydrogenase
VTGYDRNPLELALGLERGALDVAASDLATAVADADVVILATPVLAMRDILAELAPVLKPGALVSDVASTKSAVTSWAREFGVNFVGGHPMAGSERSGMVAARLNLLRGALYMLTGDSPLLEGLVRGIGARPMFISPEAHDTAVAAISHVPFLTSTALVKATMHDPRWAEWAPIAATGYRDVTRLASGDPAMYRDICLTNAGAIAPLLRELAAELGRVAADLEDRAALEELFQDARTRREDWLQRQESFRLP